MLSALDVHTSRWVVEKCLSGDLVRGRTVLLVTHNVALTKGIAEFTVSIGPDGRIASQGTVSDALKANKALRTEIAKVDASDSDQEKLIDGPEYTPKAPTALSGKLMTVEEIVEGHVSMSSC